MPIREMYASIMIADRVTLPAAATVENGIATPVSGRFHHMPVIDEQGRFVCRSASPTWPSFCRPRP